jgi:hypothetical protein
MANSRVVAAAILVLFALSCSKQVAEKRQATVLLQDGSQVTGAVVASTASEITLAGNDNITRTIPMPQVKSVEYHDAAPAAGAPQAAVPTDRQPVPAGTAAAQPKEVPQSAPPASRPSTVARTFELASGTELHIRTNESIDSGKAAEGQHYAAEVSRDVLNSAGAVVIPKGSQAQVVIRSVSQGGKIRGASDLVVNLSSVTVRGRRYQLDSSDVEQRGKDGVGANKRTATYTGGGAAVGAIIGAIAGGGKGAAIGAGAGAGAGALTQILTKGKTIRIPAESTLTFRLESPLRVAAE